MSRRGPVDLGPVEPGGVSIEEAVREIRLQAGRLAKVRRALNQILRSCALPSAAEIREIGARNRPVGQEVRFIAALCRAVAELEDCETDLWLATERKILDRLEKDWQQGWRPHGLKLRRIERAVAARRAGTSPASTKNSHEGRERGSEGVRTAGRRRPRR